MPNWTHEYEPLELTVEGDDFISELAAAEVERDEVLRSASTSGGWGYGRTKAKDAQQKVFDLIRIRNAVASICKIHGAPPKTNIQLASIGTAASGMAGWQRMDPWEGPFIFLGTSVYDLADGQEMMDAYCGLGIHETEHLISTRKLGLRLQSKALSDPKRIMWENLLEDERIENLARKRSPGYAPYLQASKRVIFQAKKFLESLTNWDKLTDLDKLTTLMFTAIRCPYHLSPAMKTWKTVKGDCAFDELRGVIPHTPVTEDDVEMAGARLVEYFNRMQDIYDKLAAKDDEDALREALGDERVDEMIEDVKKEMADKRAEEKSSATDCTEPDKEPDDGREESTSDESSDESAEGGSAECDGDSDGSDSESTPEAGDDGSGEPPTSDDPGAGDGDDDGKSSTPDGPSGSSSGTPEGETDGVDTGPSDDGGSGRSTEGSDATGGGGSDPSRSERGGGPGEPGGDGLPTDETSTTGGSGETKEDSLETSDEETTERGEETTGGEHPTPEGEGEPELPEPELDFGDFLMELAGRDDGDVMKAEMDDTLTRLDDHRLAKETDTDTEALLKDIEATGERMRKALEKLKDLSDLTEAMKDDRLADAKRDEKKLDDLKEASDALEKSREGERFGLIDLARMMEAFDGGTMDLEESCELAKAEDERLEFVEAETCPCDKYTRRRTVISHPRPDESAKRDYLAGKKLVQPFIGRTKNALSFRRGDRLVDNRELIEGRLDGRRLGRARSTKRLFKNTSKITSKGLAICLLLDESGSMGTCKGSYQDWNGRAGVAKQIAILFAEALANVSKIELEIYSYASCNRHDDNYMKYLYGKRQKNVYSIGGYGDGGQNYDHMAIREAGRLFKENTDNENRLMLVLSDGAPCGNDYGGDTARRATRDEVRKLEKEMDVVQVAITRFKSSSMFKHYIQFLDLRQLVNDMRKLLQKVIRSVS